MACPPRSDGHILWLEADDEGRFAAEHELLVPRLAVRKDWCGARCRLLPLVAGTLTCCVCVCDGPRRHEGLDDSFVEASISLSEFVHRHEAAGGKQKGGSDQRSELDEDDDDDDHDDDDDEEEEEGGVQGSQGSVPIPAPGQPVVSMVDESDGAASHADAPSSAAVAAPAAPGPSSSRVQRGRRGRAPRDSVGLGVEDRRQRPASRRLLQARESFEDVRGTDAAADDSALPSKRPPPGKVPGEDQARPGHVLVDAHVLANPVVADIDGDGHHELIVAVSYFFDREQYPDPALWEQQLGKGVNPSKCVLPT